MADSKAPKKKLHKEKKGKATALRGTLTFILIAIIIGGIGAYYVAFLQLRTYSIEVSHKVADADASSTQVQGLQALKAQLSADQELVSKANRIFATPDNYQQQAVHDIENYADLANISIVSTSFNTEGSGSTSEKPFTVQLGSNVPYNDFVSFLKGVESNIPKIEVKSFTIQSDATNSGNVTVQNLTMQILVGES